MDLVRRATLVNFGLRIAYGAWMVAAPERVGRPWLGDPADAPPTQVPLRGVGAREIALHAVGGAAILRGGPARPWLLAGLCGDLSDLAATLAARRELPDGSVRATLAAGGGSALLTAALLAVSED